MVFGNRILEQRDFQATLQLEKDLTKFLMDRVADAIFWVNPDARFLYVNDAACDLVGYSREELLFMTMHDVKPDFSQQDWLQYWGTIKRQGYLYFESLHWNKESQIPLEITFTYMEYKGSEYGCILVRNISQRKQASLALQRENQALECKLQQLVVELKDTNQQLCREKAWRQQAEMALEQEKQLAEYKAHFVSMVSHKFRTSLNTVSLSTSLLKRHCHHWTEEKKLQYLQRLQTAAEHLNQLMDEVLMLGRPKVGKLMFEPEQVNLDQFCRDIFTQIDLSQSRYHTVTFVNQGDCKAVCVDKKLLRLILTNLLSNVIKYSSPDSTFDLVLECLDEKVILQIKGRGIDAPIKDQQILFEPFDQGGNVGDIPGNGLGLPLVKKLLDLYGGQITIASEVSVGTTFTITLPVSG